MPRMRDYDIHSVTLSNRQRRLKEDGAKAFGGTGEFKEKKQKIARLERMLGKKEAEIALLRNFLGESLLPLRRFARWIS